MTDRQTITVNWGEVPLPNRKGVITGYQVAYTGFHRDSYLANKEDNTLETNTMVVKENVAVLRNLQLNNVYEITVAAKTSAGVGAKSDPVVKETGRFGMG